jgi:hypothetical protein
MELLRYWCDDVKVCMEEDFSGEGLDYGTVFKT